MASRSGAAAIRLASVTSASSMSLPSRYLPNYGIFAGISVRRVVITIHGPGVCFDSAIV